MSVNDDHIAGDAKSTARLNAMVTANSLSVAMFAFWVMIAIAASNRPV